MAEAVLSDQAPAAGGGLLALVVRALTSLAGRTTFRLEAAEARLAALERRVATLEATSAELVDGGLRYCGVYDVSKRYKRGDAVSHAGSLWIARAPVSAVPPGAGPSNWTLACKRGKDGFRERRDER